MSERREPCACGGELVSRHPSDIEQVVRAHRAEPAHREWAALAQLRGELVAPHRIRLAPTGWPK